MIAATSTTVWYTMRASGIVALVLLTVTVVLGILTAGRYRTPSWPAFAQADLHKRISLVALVFLGLHVASAVIDTYVPVGLAALVVPFASGYRPAWVALGTVAFDLLAAVAISSGLRRHIRVRTWRAIHWLAYGAWPLAMVHSLGVGADASQRWFDRDRPYLHGRGPRRALLADRRTSPCEATTRCVALEPLTRGAGSDRSSTGVMPGRQGSLWDSAVLPCPPSSSMSLTSCRVR